MDDVFREVASRGQTGSSGRGTGRGGGRGGAGAGGGRGGAEARGGGGGVDWDSLVDQVFYEEAIRMVDSWV